MARSILVFQSLILFLDKTFGMPLPRVEFFPHRIPAGYQYIYRYKKKTVAATFDASSDPKTTQIDAAREIVVTTLQYDQ